MVAPALLPGSCAVALHDCWYVSRSEYGGGGVAVRPTRLGLYCTGHLG